VSKPSVLLSYVVGLCTAVCALIEGY